jgi:uncharacterized protein
MMAISTASVDSSARSRRSICPGARDQTTHRDIYPGNIDTAILPGYIVDVNCTVFHQYRKVASGTNDEIACFLRDKPQGGEYLAFDDETGRQLDFDFRAVEAPQSLEQQTEPRGRGRPRLGVIAREVTLLPSHWDWLNVQPGGASVALRKLVDAARRTSGDRDRVRAAQESAYRFISAIAGNLPGFEEGTRALFAYDRRRFGDLISGWPEDIRDYTIRLAFADHDPAG